MIYEGPTGMEGWKSQGVGIRNVQVPVVPGGGRFLNGPVKGLRQPLPGAGLPGAPRLSNGNTATSHLWPRGLVR